MCLSKREIRIQFDRPLEEWDRRGSALRDVDRLSRAVCLQGIEGGGGRLDQGYLVRLDGCQRLADAHAEIASDLAQCVQDVFFLRSRNLLVVEDFAGLAVLGSQSH